MGLNVAELAPLDRALVEFALAERDADLTGMLAAITNVAWAWVRLDEREQACWLRYHHPDDDMGASLRAALESALRRGHDLGVIGSNYAEAVGRPWP